MHILRTSWDETWYFVQGGQGRDARKPSCCRESVSTRRLFAKGHDYMTLLYDLDNSTVEAISEGRDVDSGIACISQLFAGTNRFRLKRSRWT